MSKPTITPEDVFRIMCNTTASVMNHYTKLIPTTAMAEHFKCSRYRIRKCLQPLIDEGLVASGCENCYSDWREQFYIVRGFYITEKGKETDVYKKADQEEMEYWNTAIHTHDPALKEMAELFDEVEDHETLS